MKTNVMGAALALVAATLPAQTPSFVVRTMLPGSTIYFPVLVDLDNDGSREVAWGRNLISTQSGPALEYRSFPGNGEWVHGGTFTSTSYAAVTSHIARCAADVDGDGNQDIFVGRTVGGPSTGGTGPQPWYGQLWMGDGVGGLVDASYRLPNTRAFVARAQFADFDNDGDQDLFVCDLTRVLLWINDGLGNFKDVSTQIQGYAAYDPWCCAVLDADQDGDLDVLVSNGWGAFQPTVLYENDGAAKFRAHSQGITRFAELYVLDANADGWDDVLAVYPTQITVFLSSPSQQQMVQAPQLIPAPLAGSPAALECFIADSDGDGDLDVVADFGPTWQLWENTGQGFVVVPGALPLSTGAVFVTDYDRDGDTDLFAGSSLSPSYWISNTSREIVTLIEPSIGGTYSADVYALANHAMFVGISTNYVRQPLGALGLLYLDLMQTAPVATLLYTTRARQTVSIPIPNQPWLVGQLLCLQAADVDLATGAVRLTNAPRALVQ